MARGLRCLLLAQLLLAGFQSQVRAAPEGFRACMDGYARMLATAPDSQRAEFLDTHGYWILSPSEAAALDGPHVRWLHGELLRLFGAPASSLGYGTVVLRGYAGADPQDAHFLPGDLNPAVEGYVSELTRTLNLRLAGSERVRPVRAVLRYYLQTPSKSYFSGIHLDGGYLRVTVALLGKSTEVEPSLQYARADTQKSPFGWAVERPPTGSAVVITGRERANRRGVRAGFHQEPRGPREDRLILVVDYEPEPAGAAPR